MKKILMLAICIATLGFANAQNDAKSVYEAGKAADDVYNKAKAKLALNPEDPNVDKLSMSSSLFEAYELFMQALPLDSIPNEKGKVKPKYSKKIISAIENHIKDGDFVNAGIEFFNANKRYPEAYNAFMLAAELPSRQIFAKVSNLYPDTIRAIWVSNAGNCAYGAQQYQKAAEAYAISRQLGNNELDVFKYEIASYQNWANTDSTVAEYTKNKIFECAEQAYNLYGSADSYLFRNYINKFFLNDEFNKGVEVINAEIAKNPTNGELYQLLALFYENADQKDAAVENYLKAAEISDNYEILKDVSRKIYNFGANELQEITGDSPEATAQRQNIKVKYFENALRIAEKAKALNTGDYAIDSIIETINYGLETFF